MYFVLSYFRLGGWQAEPISSLSDPELKRVIQQLNDYSPHDVFLHYTANDAMNFGGLLTTISDSYFAGDIIETLTDFQNYLGRNNLDLILRMEEMLDLPFENRQRAMEDLIQKLQDASAMFQALHLKRFDEGKTGPLP